MDAATFAMPATERQIAYARSLALRNLCRLSLDVHKEHV